MPMQYVCMPVSKYVTKTRCAYISALRQQYDFVYLQIVIHTSC
jgi:hypothetical protein